MLSLLSYEYEHDRRRRGDLYILKQMARRALDVERLRAYTLNFRIQKRARRAVIKGLLSKVLNRFLTNHVMRFVDVSREVLFAMGPIDQDRP